MNRSAKSLKPSSIICGETGGKEYSKCQMLEPVKPLTILTPSFCAARAVFFSSSAARAFTPAGLPSPHTYGGTIAWCRSSMMSQHRLADQVALMANTCRSCFSSSSRFFAQ